VDRTTNTTQVDSLVQYMKNRMSRRAFARNALFGTAGLAAAGVTTVDVGAQNNDVALLQFALNLEFLEAEFYTIATTGLTISQVGIVTRGDVGIEGPTVGGSRVPLSQPVMNLALAIAQDEQNHVRLLQTALSANAIAKPAIDLSAAGGAATETTFLTLARAFEDIGVSAYGGAVPLITNLTLLGTTARILGTEAEHAGAIRYHISQFTPIRPTAIDAKDIVTRIISADPFSGLTETRTPGEALALLFLNATVGTDRGGFFPAGVNGSLNRV
jgi:hypothetical protein